MAQETNINGSKRENKNQKKPIFRVQRRSKIWEILGISHLILSTHGYVNPGVHNHFIKKFKLK